MKKVQRVSSKNCWMRDVNRSPDNGHTLLQRVYLGQRKKTSLIGPAG